MGKTYDNGLPTQLGFKYTERVVADDRTEVQSLEDLKTLVVPPYFVSFVRDELDENNLPKGFMWNGNDQTDLNNWIDKEGILREQVIAYSSGEGKTYDTLVDAMDVSPLPSDNTPFRIENEVSTADDGRYIYLASETDGYKFLGSIKNVSNDNFDDTSETKAFTGKKTSDYITPFLNSSADALLKQIDSRLNFKGFIKIADYPTLDATNFNAWIIIEAGNYGATTYAVGEIMYRNNSFLKYAAVNVLGELETLQGNIDAKESTTNVKLKVSKTSFNDFQKVYKRSTNIDYYTGTLANTAVPLIDAYGVIKDIQWSNLGGFEKIKLSFIKKDAGSCRLIFGGYVKPNAEPLIVGGWERILDTGSGGIDISLTEDVWVDVYDKTEKYYIRVLVNLSDIPTGFNGFIETEADEPCFVLKNKEYDISPQYGAFVIHRKSYSENDFIWHTVDRNPLISMSVFHKAIPFIYIWGGTPTNLYKLRLISRNEASWNYRFIVSESTDNGATWATFMDSGSSYTVTENPNGGITVVDRTDGTKRVLMHVDYTKLTDESQFLVWSFFNGQDGDVGANYPGLIIKPSLIDGFFGEFNGFDQSLNSNDDVKFNSVEIEGELPTGTLASPPAGLTSDDYWLDTTDSTTDPIVRQKQ